MLQRGEPAWVDVDLVVETTRSRTDAPNRLSGCVKLGVPLVRAIDADELEGAAARQVRADAAQYTYSLVELALSLQPPDGREFRRASIAVSLATPAEQTIAYSMDPMKEIVEEGRSTTLGVSADLGLFSVSAERERSSTAQVASITAYNARTSEPSWELVRVEGRALKGAYFFALITRAPIGAQTSGTVDVSAVIEKWKFLTYEAEAKQATFTVGAR